MSHDENRTDLDGTQPRHTTTREKKPNNQFNQDAKLHGRTEIEEKVERDDRVVPALGSGMSYDKHLTDPDGTHKLNIPENSEDELHGRTAIANKFEREELVVSGCGLLISNYEYGTDCDQAPTRASCKQGTRKPKT